MSHIPSRFIRSVKFPLQLLRGHAFLCRANHIDREKPLGKRQMRIMKDSSGRNGKLVFAVNARIKKTWFARLAVGRILKNAIRFTLDAKQTVRKTNLFKMLDALFLGIELSEMLENGRLRLCFINFFSHNRNIIL